MSYNNFLETTLLDEVFGGVNYVPVATLYVGLSTEATLAENITGTAVPGEPTTGSYARASVTNDNTTGWFAAVAGNPSEKKNRQTITFPTATASWGTVQTFFIADALTGGNVLAQGVLTTAKTIDDGDTASFAQNDLTITLD